MLLGPLRSDRPLLSPPLRDRHEAGGLARLGRQDRLARRDRGIEGVGAALDLAVAKPGLGARPGPGRRDPRDRDRRWEAVGALAPARPTSTGDPGAPRDPGRRRPDAPTLAPRSARVRGSATAGRRPTSCRAPLWAWRSRISRGQGQWGCQRGSTAPRRAGARPAVGVRPDAPRARDAVAPARPGRPRPRDGQGPAEGLPPAPSAQAIAGLPLYSPDELTQMARQAMAYMRRESAEAEAGRVAETAGRRRLVGEPGGPGSCPRALRQDA